MFESEFIPHISITLVALALVFFLVATVTGLKNKYIAREKRLLRALVNEREAAMDRISSEIHDNINQVLNHTRMTLGVISAYAPPGQLRSILKSEQMLEGVIRDLRNISHALNSGYLKSRGLIDFLQEEEKWINLYKDINCKLEITGKFRPLPRDTELMIIRITQECLQNVLKHAAARHLTLHLEYSSRRLTLRISDDGGGFDQGRTKSGFGLQSMYERSRIIDGALQVRSNVHSGTTVELMVPIKAGV